MPFMQFCLLCTICSQGILNFLFILSLTTLNKPDNYILITDTQQLEKETCNTDLLQCEENIKQQTIFSFFSIKTNKTLNSD